MKILFQTLLFLSFFNITIAQVNYYVDGSQGTDASGFGLAPGTSAWKTIEYAVNNVSNPATEPIIINVADGTYDLNNNQIDISRSFTNLTILGKSKNGTIVQAASDTSSSSSRVFWIYSLNNVTLKNMSIRYGKLISGDGNNGCGVLNQGTLTIDYCDIYENKFNQTTGFGNYGAGVANINGTLTITNSTIRNNTVGKINGGTFYGGGIGILNGETNISNSTISNNISNGGGGISIISSTSTPSKLEIENSTISENQAIAFNASGDTARGDFGGLRISVFSNGNSITTNINSCTIFNNFANRAFGGIGLASTPVNGSSAIIFNIKNSIVGGNNSFDIGGNLLTPKITVNSLGYNLIQNFNSTNIQVDSSSQAGSNIYNKSPQCSTLAVNNSTNGTLTCMILSTSPARDKIPSGSPNGAPALDQRGAGRNGNYDIGAYEWWGDDGALPVELVSFTASVINGNQILLNWKTATETNNYGFEIMRSSDFSEDWKCIGFVEGNGNSNSPKYYTFIDKNLKDGSKFNYRLKQIDLDGKYEYSKILEINLIPAKFSLTQNYPNPFNPSTSILFTVPEKNLVTLIVYDLLGNLVQELLNETKDPGVYEIKFDGSNLSNGVYFYKLQTNNFVDVKKMILLK